MRTIYAGAIDNPDIAVRDVIHTSHREEVPYVVGGTDFTRGCIVMHLAKTGVPKPVLGIIPEKLHLERRLRDINSYYGRLGGHSTPDIDIPIKDELNFILNRYFDLCPSLGNSFMSDNYPNLIPLVPRNIEEHYTC